MQEARPLQPRAVAAGLAHTCLLTEAGDAYAFGWNGHGQLGTGDTQDAHLPELLEAPSTTDSPVMQVRQLSSPRVCPGGVASLVQSLWLDIDLSVWGGWTRPAMA